MTGNQPATAAGVHVYWESRASNGKWATGRYFFTRDFRRTKTKKLETPPESAKHVRWRLFDAAGFS